MYLHPNITWSSPSQRYKNSAISKVASQTRKVQNPATQWMSKANVPSEAKDTTETDKMSETSGKCVQKAEYRGKPSSG